MAARGAHAATGDAFDAMPIVENGEVHLRFNLCLKVGFIDLTQNCRSIWLLYDTVEFCVSSALSHLEVDHEHSPITNSIRGCLRRIDISWLRGSMFPGHRPFAGSNGR